MQRNPMNFKALMAGIAASLAASAELFTPGKNKRRFSRRAETRVQWKAGRSKYKPHQGAQEIARRSAKILKFDPFYVGDHSHSSCNDLLKPLRSSKA